MNNISFNTTYATHCFIMMFCICLTFCNGCKPKASPQKPVVKLQPQICTMNRPGSKSMSCHAGAPSRLTALSGHKTF